MSKSEPIYLHYGGGGHPSQTVAFRGTGSKLLRLIREAKREGTPLRIQVGDDVEESSAFKKRVYGVGARRARVTYGDQRSCKKCGQDVEWTGKTSGWRDRGGGSECLPYEDRRLGEIVRPKGKHKA